MDTNSTGNDEEALKMGYKNIYRYPGGIKAWGEAGYPVDKAQ